MRRWLKEWEKSTEGREFVSHNAYRLDFAVAPDGRFRVSDLPAGKYIVLVMAYPPDGSATVLGKASRTLEIPPIDLQPQLPDLEPLLAGRLDRLLRHARGDAVGHDGHVGAFESLALDARQFLAPTDRRFGDPRQVGRPLAGIPVAREFDAFRELGEFLFVEDAADGLLAREGLGERRADAVGLADEGEAFVIAWPRLINAVQGRLRSVCG